MADLISPDYLALQKELHSHGKYGISSGRWVGPLKALIARYRAETVLDYGCGRGKLKAGLGDIVREYDPAIPGKDAEPKGADIVVCTDVLEHIEPDKLDNVLAHLRGLTGKLLFFNIATRPAGKFLADGRNAHLIIEPGSWWRARLVKHFHIVLWDDLGHEVNGEAVPLAASRSVAAAPMPVVPAARASNARRRKLTKQWRAVFEDWKRNSAKYGDALTRVETISLWENCDDEPADVQVAVNIVEHLLDTHAAMRDIKRLANKAAVFCIELDVLRNGEAWRKIISKHFSIINFEQFDNRIVVLAAATVKVDGVTPIAAGTPEGRWANIETNCKAVRQRVRRAEKHDRRAIVACYGPTLKDNIARLIEEHHEEPSDIISVSGAHDFLVGSNIIPTFHVECDPRPHKADNINRPQPGVRYLISSMAHPRLVEKLGGHDVALWHISGEQSIRLIDELEPDAFMVGGGGNVGLRAIALLHELGYRKFSIYGMDCSFSDDGAERWSGPHAQKANPSEQPLCQAKVGERIFTTSPIYLSYAANFFELVGHLPDATFRVYGDSLLQAWCRLNFAVRQIEPFSTPQSAMMREAI